MLTLLVGTTGYIFYTGERGSLYIHVLHSLTNSDSALHTSAMSPNPQDPFGMNQQMGRGPPQRNGELGFLPLGLFTY
ncbi:hypothetical protein PO909_023679 [Leuciscus waleckii]